MNLNFLAAPAFELATDLLIRANTKGDKTKQAARAADIAAIVNGLGQLNAGNAATGLATMQAALSPGALTPGEALAFQAFLSNGVNKIQAIQTLVEQTAAGQAAVAVLNPLLANIGSAILAVCAAYPAPPPAAATTASAAPSPTSASMST